MNSRFICSGVTTIHSKKDVQVYYDNFWKPRAECQATYDVHNRLNIVIKSFLSECNGDTVLDLGCGEGASINCLAERFRVVVGMDVSRVGVKKAWKRSQFKRKCNFIVADVEHLPFKHSCFDVVFMVEVLEHLSSQAQALQDINTILKPSGHFVLTTPNRLYRDFSALIYKVALKSFDETGQIIENQLYPASLRSLVNTSFQIEKERGVYFAVPFIENLNSAFLLSLRNWLSETLERCNCSPKIALHQCLLCSPK